MSDNKLVKSLLDAATITLSPCRWDWLDWAQDHQGRPDQRPQCQCHELRQVHSRRGGQHRPEEVSGGPEDTPNQCVSPHAHTRESQCETIHIHNGNCRYHGWRGRP